MNTPLKKASGRVFVFERIELVLLFFFFMVMTVTAFILGMRLGKKQTLELTDQMNTSITTPVASAPAAPGTLEIKSQKEEALEKLETPNVAESEAATDTTSDPTDDIDETTFKKLQDEFEKVNTNSTADEAEVAAAAAPETPVKESVKEPVVDVVETELPVNKDKAFLTPDPSFIGKFTIQLGSYKTLNDAQQFAEGFLTKGYKPLINEVEIQGKGTWYRVSLGVFESSKAAKQYVDNEKDLFGKQSFVISEIQ
jgi:cell division protein FtsN